MEKLMGWFFLVVTLCVTYKVIGIGGVVLFIIPTMLIIRILHSLKANNSIIDDFSSSENYKFDHSNDIETPIPDASEIGENWWELPY